MNWNAILNTVVNVCVDIFWKLLASVVVFFIGRLLIKLVLRLLKGNKFKHVDKTAMTFIVNFVRIALYSVLGISIVAIMGVPMASVITVFATAGAAIALAVQGSFSNLMGGIMLLIFKPLSVGDLIEIEGKLGTVQEVGIFYTRIKTPDNVNVSIPNGTMTSSVLTNFSREETRRADITLSVAYGTDFEKVKEVILGVIAANDKALSDPAPFVRVTSMQDSYVEFTVRVHTKASDFGALKCDLYEQCAVAFQKEGIEIPFPQIDVHLDSRSDR